METKNGMVEVIIDRKLAPSRAFLFYSL